MARRFHNMPSWLLVKGSEILSINTYISKVSMAFKVYCIIDFTSLSKHISWATYLIAIMMADFLKRQFRTIVKVRQAYLYTQNQVQNVIEQVDRIFFGT